MCAGGGRQVCAGGGRLRCVQEEGGLGMCRRREA